MKTKKASSPFGLLKKVRKNPMRRLRRKYLRVFRRVCPESHGWQR